MKGSLLYCVALTVRELFLKFNQALLCVTSPSRIIHTISNLFHMTLLLSVVQVSTETKRGRVGWSFCCSFATGDFISFSRISSSTSRFPKRKQGYEHFLEFPFLSHRFFQEQFSATVLCNHHLYLAPKHFHLSPNNLFLIPSF